MIRNRPIYFSILLASAQDLHNSSMNFKLSLEIVSYIHVECTWFKVQPLCLSLHPPHSPNEILIHSMRMKRII